MKQSIIFITCILLSSLAFSQKTIQELPRKTSVPDSTWLMIVGNPTVGTLYKMSVDNFRDSVLSIATLGQTDTTSLSNRINLKANIASPTFTGTVSGITASMVGLGNVNNTSDANKPISTATQTALDTKQATLVSGTNLKTVNGNTLLGSGNLSISGTGGDSTNYFFVKQSYGDGITDATTEIQGAINRAKAVGGGTVFIPHGTYLVTATLIIDTSNINILGSGAGTELLGSTNYGDIFYARPNTIPAPYANYFHDIGFYNFSIQSSVTRTSGYAIRTNYTHNCTVSGVVIGFIRTEQNNVITKFYNGISFENESNSLLTNSQIYAWHYGVYFTGTQIGDPYRNTNNFDGLITGNCFILGDTSKWNASDASVGVYIADGCGGVQIEECNVSFYTNCIRVGSNNRELFLNHGFVADNSGEHGVYIEGGLNVLQMTGSWSAGCGRSPGVAAGGGYSVYVDSSLSTSLAVNITGGTFYSSNNGLYFGTGTVVLTGVSSYGHTVNQLVFGENVVNATINGGRISSFTNLSVAAPKIRGVLGLDDSGGGGLVSSFDVGANANYTTITNGEQINLVNGDNTTAVRTGNSLTFNAFPSGVDSWLQYNTSGVFGSSIDLKHESGLGLVNRGYYVLDIPIDAGYGILSRQVGTSNLLFQMGFNAKGFYGGTPDALSGNQFFIYNFQEALGGANNYYWGFNNSGDNYWGSSSSLWSVKVQQPRTGSIPLSIQGQSGQTEDLFNVTKNGGSAGGVITVAASGNIGFGEVTPHASALVEMESTNQGLLIPRMTKTQRDAISSPATGLMVYQTDNTPGLRVWNGTNWMRFTETAD